MNETSLLLVYGTLRYGMPNNRLMKDLVEHGRATVKGTLYLSGFLPMLGKGEDTVVGEVYEIPDEARWDRLDVLEGHPNWYQREVVDALREDGQTVRVWVYFMRPELLETEHRKVRLESGDYTAYYLGTNVRRNLK